MGQWLLSTGHVSHYLLGCMSLFLNTICMVCLYHMIIIWLSHDISLHRQYMSWYRRDSYSWLQTVRMFSCSVATVVWLCVTIMVGRWKEYPVATTAYSYFFGAMFMGLASLYYPFQGQVDVYKIPLEVGVEWWRGGGSSVIHYLFLHSRCMLWCLPSLSRLLCATCSSHGLTCTFPLP